MNKKLIGIIFLGLVIFSCRFIPHPDNFSPLLALCLGVGYFARGSWVGFVVPLVAMMAADLSFGLYPGWAFVYIPLVAVVALGCYVKASSLRILGLGACASLIFFLVSNFGVWVYSGMYSKTFTGLMSAYAAAIPFFHRTLLSTWVYSAVVFTMIFVVLGNEERTAIESS